MRNAKTIVAVFGTDAPHEDADRCNPVNRELVDNALHRHEELGRNSILVLLGAEGEKMRAHIEECMSRTIYPGELDMSRSDTLILEAGFIPSSIDEPSVHSDSDPDFSGRTSANTQEQVRNLNLISQQLLARGTKVEQVYVFAAENCVQEARELLEKALKGTSFYVEDTKLV